MYTYGYMLVAEKLVIFGATVIIAILGIEFMARISWESYFVLGEIVCGGIILRYAPLATETRRISTSENGYFKKVARIILGVEGGVGVLALILENGYVMSVILMAHVDPVYGGKSQGIKLIEAYEKYVNDDVMKVLRKVAMLTPENIHLNAFMYEQIWDMSLTHLYDLYQEVKELANVN